MKQLKINIPDGHEIDLEKSNLENGVVFFKEVKKQLTYEDIAKEMFSNKKTCFYSTQTDQIEWIDREVNRPGTPDLATTKEQLESILALNKLCNVAKWLNEGWLPKFGSSYYRNYVIVTRKNGLEVDCCSHTKNSAVYFKSRDLANKAIEILGEDEIRKALTLNH